MSVVRNRAPRYTQVEPSPPPQKGGVKPPPPPKGERVKWNRRNSSSYAEEPLIITFFVGEPLHNQLVAAGLIDDNEDFSVAATSKAAAEGIVQHSLKEQGTQCYDVVVAAWAAGKQ